MQRRFNWLELVAIPVACAMMEAQLLAIMLQFFQAVIVRTQPGVLTTPLLLFFLLLACHWWALYAQHYQYQPGRLYPVLTALGFFMPLSILICIQSLIEPSLPVMSFLFMAILYAWYRGRKLVSTDLSMRPLLTLLQLGLVVFLSIFILLTVMVNKSPVIEATATILHPIQATTQPSKPILCTYNQAEIDAQVAAATRSLIWFDKSQTLGTIVPTFLSALPLFILSWLVASGLIRLALLKNVQAQQRARIVTGTRAYRWLWILLPLLEIMLAIMLWTSITPDYLTRFNLNWLTFFGSHAPVVRVIKPECKKSGPPRANHVESRPIKSAPGSTLALLILLVLVCMPLLVTILLLIFRNLGNGQRASPPIEIRQRLAFSDLREERSYPAHARRAWITPPDLDQLDPDSVRASYRALLQAVQQHDPLMARRPFETPDEYQARLQTLLTTMTGDDAERLHALTDAYNHERYGGPQRTRPLADHIRQWVIDIRQRLQQT